MPTPIRTLRSRRDCRRETTRNTSARWNFCSPAGVRIARLSVELETNCPRSERSMVFTSMGVPALRRARLSQLFDAGAATATPDAATAISNRRATILLFLERRHWVEQQPEHDTGQINARRNVKCHIPVAVGP